MRPIVIATRDGEMLDAALVDEKGYKKSLEQGHLWTLNPDTGRLLPHTPAYRLVSITDEGRWYRALVEPPESGKPPAEAPTAGAGDAAGSPEGPAPQAGARDGEPPTEAPAATAAGARAEVLSRLYELVRERRRTLPEGSYTTHLFGSGLEKIRKKTGEEAVELILARERGEIVSESADLIYHLLVLLCASEIEVSEVLDELTARLES
ncbi:MAG: phosphoribosyl-ATP diphosphatase [Spirochaetia bacterium]